MPTYSGIIARRHQLLGDFVAVRSGASGRTDRLTGVHVKRLPGLGRRNQAGPEGVRLGFELKAAGMLLGVHHPADLKAGGASCPGAFPEVPDPDVVALH